MLSNRIRPDVEAAPWVIEEIERLEQQLAAAQEELRTVKEIEFPRRVEKVAECWREKLAAAQSERDAWCRQVGAILDTIPLGSVLRASGSIGDAVEHFKKLHENISSIETQLAAALAACEAKDEALDHYMEYGICESSYYQIRDALAIKPDATALHAHDDSLIDRCVAICVELYTTGVSGLGGPGDATAQDCADAILELKKH